ncbi:unnamed protein product [Larinioides sclopetarius]|uniref:TFIID subunit TAF5 NTD2 domain-containing protein n=1 Tax=Larinioides sclopetarius TaxID=280406 RepID=A0AAV2BVL8_9ARAC
MSISNISGESFCEGKDISIQEFKKNELLSFYNHVIYADLLVISNRDLHLAAITKEFIKFSRFISQPSNKKHFLVFLIPVFQHLYLLLRSHKGKSDAERFIKYFKHLDIPSDVTKDLSKCETFKELQFLIYSQARTRVKLSSNAYHTLMNWLRDCFSESLQMFNILRILHENFHVDIYHDKDDEDFSGVEAEVLQAIQKWLADYEAQKIQKKSEPKVSAKTCKTPQSVDDLMAQKMSELEIEAETPKMPETPITSESNDSESNFEVKSSMFKMRDSARRYLEKVRQSGWDIEQIEKALLNPPDFSTEVSTDIVKDDQEMDFLEDPLPMADENADRSPLENTVPVSPGGSEYVIWSDASTERNDEDDIQALDSIDIDDQDLNDGNEGSTEIQHNIEPTDQDMSDVTTDDVKDEEHQNTSNQHFFNDFYKTNFHSAYPITISGQDVLCSSDVSSDLLYLACGFESCKISTWRLCCKEISKYEFTLQPLGTLRGHKGIVYALSIDSNRRTLISGSHDCTVKIWDLEESTCLSTISAHSAPVYAICVSPNSRYFLSASEDKDVVLFWYDDIYPVRVYSGHSTEAINCVQFHPNCSYFATASSDGNVFLFKINYDSCPVRMFSKHIAKVYTLAFSPCGKNLASADVEGVIIIWDILTYAPITICETGQGIRSISYDTSGSFIAALFYYKSWKVYNVEEKSIDVVIEAESVGVPKSVHFSTDNKMIIIQYIEADKNEIAETKETPKTKITKVN